MIARMGNTKPPSMNMPLKLAILATGKKQYRIAAESGINEAIISKIVNGSREPTEAQKKALAKVLRRPVDELFPSVAA
jgi:transcriptional regulator with XRE-family HTH domain